MSHETIGPGPASTTGTAGHRDHAVADAARPLESEPLAAALNPSAIAVIGASDNPNKIGGRPLLYLSRFGFRGRVYPVNPHRSVVQGQPALPDVASLPEPPDMAIIATPGQKVEEAVVACAARGVRTAVVMASGFGETHDPAAIATEARLVATARAAGMRLVGPNSQGLANFGTGAIASFSTMFLEVPPADGPVAIISQSGAMSVVPYGHLRARGIGVRHAHATGNDADVSLPELAAAVVQDPQVRLLLLYIESIRDADALARAAALARDRDVPIVALKTGRTSRGRAAARSHTGALANEDRVVDAFFREHGIWRVRGTHDLITAAELYLKGWRPGGGRVAVVSNSGASCVMAADAVREMGLELATLEPDTVETIARQLPAFATATNPIDLTAALLSNGHLFDGILPALAADPAVDHLLISLPVAGAGYDVPAFAAAAAEHARQTGRPVILAAPQETVAAVFRERGVITFSSELEALAALAQLVTHTALMRGTPLEGDLRRSDSSQTPENTPSLPMAEALDLMRALGLSVAPFHLCVTADEVRVAFRRLGPPAELTACLRQRLTSDSLTARNICSEEGATRAFTELEERRRQLEVAGDGVLLTRAPRSLWELSIGVRRDRVFGLVVTIGDGGWDDRDARGAVVLLSPVEEGKLRAGLRRLRAGVVLTDPRVAPALDMAPLRAVVTTIARYLFANEGRIAGIELNPVSVGDGGRDLEVRGAVVTLSDGVPAEIPLDIAAPAGR